jgi:hypothetical protein
MNALAILVEGRCVTAFRSVAVDGCVANHMSDQRVVAAAAVNGRRSLLEFDLIGM